MIYTLHEIYMSDIRLLTGTTLLQTSFGQVYQFYYYTQARVDKF
jgi:hypothetical protein